MAYARYRDLQRQIYRAQKEWTRLCRERKLIRADAMAEKAEEAAARQQKSDMYNASRPHRTVLP